MSKQLYRSSEHKLIAGVCAGVAEYFEIDPTIVRIIWLITLFAGFGILAYIVCWIIMPEDDTYESSSDANSSVDKEKSKQILGVVLITVGTIFIIDRFFSWFNISILIPAAIILIGLYILFGARRESK